MAHFDSVGRFATISSTWEQVDEFRNSFPSFQLKDELFLEGGRDVVYVRRGRTQA
jgi:hypothetical protein